MYTQCIDWDRGRSGARVLGIILYAQIQVKALSVQQSMQRIEINWKYIDSYIYETFKFSSLWSKLRLMEVGLQYH